MIIRLVGDLHGKVQYKDALAASPHPVVQLGDLDLRGYERWAMPEGAQAWFIDGNHDHYPSLSVGAAAPYTVARGLLHLPRGYLSGRVLFLGGADSNDRAYRIEGLDWFAQESICEEDMRVVRHIPKGRVETVVSHCAPVSIAPFYFHQFSGVTYSGTPSENALEEVLYLHRPRRWFFGHHHVTRTVDREGVVFRCLAEGEFADEDLPLNEADFLAG